MQQSRSRCPDWRGWCTAWFRYRSSTTITGTRSLSYGRERSPCCLSFSTLFSGKRGLDARRDFNLVFRRRAVSGIWRDYLCGGPVGAEPSADESSGFELPPCADLVGRGDGDCRTVVYSSVLAEENRH